MHVVIALLRTIAYCVRTLEEHARVYLVCTLIYSKETFNIVYCIQIYIFNILNYILNILLTLCWKIIEDWCTFLLNCKYAEIVFLCTL